jgi:hypothetical protein
VLNGLRQCVFCREDIRPGASVCPHCGGTLTPLQDFADRQAALEQRLAALEAALAAQQTDSAANAPVEVPATAVVSVSPRTEIRWPHMADNIFLGLTVLVAAHWLATTLPAGGRTWFRLVALVVALPFGFRFEHHARAGTSGQVLAALAFGSVGTLAIGVLDLVLAGHGGPTPTPQDVVASVATIALSHFAGSAWAHFRQVRDDPAPIVTPPGGVASPLMRIQPAQIKGTAEAIKALYDAAAPLAAGAAALWAAFGHVLF